MLVILPHHSTLPSCDKYLNFSSLCYYQVKVFNFDGLSFTSYKRVTPYYHHTLLASLIIPINKDRQKFIQEQQLELIQPVVWRKANKVLSTYGFMDITKDKKVIPANVANILVSNAELSVLNRYYLIALTSPILESLPGCLRVEFVNIIKKRVDVGDLIAVKSC